MASGWELTEWEKRREWYSVIKLGKDVTTQTNLLKKQSKEMISAQAASANAIIASQHSVREGIENLAYRIEDGMAGLKAVFEFGISEVVWQIEQNRQVLKNILEVLMAPLDTQAKELRKRAEDAYANGWFEDALEDFLQSEMKNKYDFTVHISIGMIYLFQKVDRDKAFEYFQKAVKYARPKSKYHASFALLHGALIKRDCELIKVAEELSAEAIELTPDFTEARYQNAEYNAQLKNIQKSIGNLEAAIKIDPNYCLKADNDSMFDPVRPDVNKLFERLRDGALTDCSSRLASLERRINSINDVTAQAHLTDFSSFAFRDFQSAFSDIRKYLGRQTYFDSLAALAKVSQLEAEGKQYFIAAEEALSSAINSASSKIGNTEYSIEQSRIADRLRTFKVIWVIVTLVALSPGISSCVKGFKNPVGVDGIGDVFSGGFYIVLIGGILCALFNWINGKMRKSKVSAANSYEIVSLKSGKEQLEDHLRALFNIS